MKKVISCLAIILFTLSVHAQKAEYKDGIIKLDGKDIAKVKKEKNEETLGLVNNFEIRNMKDELLIIAAYSTDFPEDPDNNMDNYYKLSFVGLDKTGYFRVSKLGTEKSLAKLIGNNGIIKDDKLDNDAVFKFIAKLGKTPPAPPADYTIVTRDMGWPVSLEQGGNIQQNGKVIGTFKDVTKTGSNVDYYEFSLPSGLIVARVNFANGNNAQECEALTMKDNRKRLVPIPGDKVIISASSIDRNDIVLKRIVKWMVNNGYL